MVSLTCFCSALDLGKKIPGFYIDWGGYVVVMSVLGYYQRLTSASSSSDSLTLNIS
jgi:hypothetical protein